MVAASILPGRGIGEVSMMPSRIRPGPPRWTSHRRALFFEASTRIANRRIFYYSSTNAVDKLQILSKLEFRRLRKDADFRSQAVIKLEPLQARKVEIIMDVMRQVDANELDSKAEARRPLLSNDFKIFRR